MKKIVLPSLIALGALASCGDAKENTSGNSIIEHSEEIAQNNKAKQDSISKAEATTKEDITFISLWESSLRKSDPKGFKWTSSKVKYGRSMKFIRDSVVGKKTYSLVELVDGKQGWINNYVVAQKAKTAIVISPANIYTAPDPLELTKDKLKVGDIVVVYDEQVGSYYKFTTEKRGTKGFIKSSGAVSSDPNDIEAGVAFGHVLSMEKSEQTKAFEEFLENESYKKSTFGDKAQKMLDEGIEEEIVEALTDSVSNVVMEAESAKEAVEEKTDETVEELGF